MPHDARAIANMILSEWDAREHFITNKKINKLVYFAHGFVLARLRRPLIVNHIEAWEHGPVVRVTYDAFKRFGFRPIAELATYFDYKSGVEVVARADLRDAEMSIVRKAMDEFMGLSGDELERITHEAGSPWCSVWDGGRKHLNRIPNEMIETYFADRFRLIRNHS